MSEWVGGFISGGLFVVLAIVIMFYCGKRYVDKVERELEAEREAQMKRGREPNVSPPYSDGSMM